MFVVRPCLAAGRRLAIGDLCGTITSVADLDAAETAGNVFLQINPGAANPYEIDTGNLLICPTVSSHA